MEYRQYSCERLRHAHKTLRRAVVIAALLLVAPLFAQPGPGDVFREYRWFHETGDAGQALRIGGKQGQHHPDRGSSHDYINAAIVLPHDIDLQHAVKAEVVIEKVLCHDGTTGLAVQFNDGPWRYAPEAAAIPSPQADYQHHFYPLLRVPLSEFKQGTGNRFRMRVDAKHPWRWPQNLINGMHVRVYYDPQAKPHPTGEIVSVQAGDRLGVTVKLAVRADSPNGAIKRVDYLGLYEDVNLEGDGVYRQWHYHYDHSQLRHHIGSAFEAPFPVTWDTSWVPDQKEPMHLTARITDATGLTTQTASIVDLQLARSRRTVELCKPYDIPKKWVTRSGEKSEYFDLAGDPQGAIAMQLVWSSWSPGYMEGLFINDIRVYDREGPKYAYYAHRVTLEDVSMLRQGQNVLKTGKTPKYNGKMVHGMEVNWPGVMVLVKYK